MYIYGVKRFNKICRSSGQIIDKKTFNVRSKLAREFFYPSFKPLKLASDEIYEFSDPLLEELAKRERANLEGDVLVFNFHYSY